MKSDAACCGPWWCDLDATNCWVVWWWCWWWCQWQRNANLDDAISHAESSVFMWWSLAGDCKNCWWQKKPNNVLVIGGDMQITKPLMKLWLCRRVMVKSECSWEWSRERTMERSDDDNLVMVILVKCQLWNCLFPTIGVVGVFGDENDACSWCVKSPFRWTSMANPRATKKGYREASRNVKRLCSVGYSDPVEKKTNRILCQRKIERQLFVSRKIRRRFYFVCECFFSMYFDLVCFPPFHILFEAPNMSAAKKAFVLKKW